jgi:hypothetical protein
MESFTLNISTMTQHKNVENKCGGSWNDALSMYIYIKSPKSHDTVPFSVLMNKLIFTDEYLVHFNISYTRAYQSMNKRDEIFWEQNYFGKGYIERPAGSEHGKKSGNYLVNMPIFLQRWSIPLPKMLLVLLVSGERLFGHFVHIVS